MWRQSDFRRAIQQQGCCLCEDKRKRLPRFFRETTKNPGLEDNKHALVQTTYTMVGRLYVDLTICWELLSGLYYQEFEAMLDASDVTIHRPSRTNEGTDWAYTTDGEPATPTACRETYDGGSTYKGRGNCGVPHYVYGETGKVLTKKDITGEETDERYDLGVPCYSWPSDEVVGGFISDFELIRTDIVTPARRGPKRLKLGPGTTHRLL